MIIQGQPGPIYQTAGTPNIRMDNFGALAVTELNGRNYENAYRGNTFFAAHQAAATFSANGITSVSAVGIVIYNPPSSTKNLVPKQLEAVMTNYITTATSFNLAAVVSAYSATGPTTAGALTAYSAKGAATTGSIAQAVTSLTFAANPVVWKQLFSAIVTTTIAAAIPAPQAMTAYDFGGSLIIPPGQGLAIVGSSASTGLVSITWDELVI